MKHSPLDLIDEKSMRRVVRDFVNTHEKKWHAARALGMTHAHLANVLGGRLPVSRALAAKLGYERLNVYAPVDEDGQGAPRRAN